MSSVIKSAGIEFCEWQNQALKARADNKLMDEQQAYLNDTVP